MSGEETIVDVDCVSDGENEWIDVGTDESVAGELSSGTDNMDDEGGEGTSRQGHHNQLEKQRRRNLNYSYNRLTRCVKMFNPALAKSKLGRDKTLEIALKQLKELTGTMDKYKKASQFMMEKCREELQETVCKEKRKELEEVIRELDSMINYKFIPNKKGQEGGDLDGEDGDDSNEGIDLDGEEDGDGSNDDESYDEEESDADDADDPSSTQSSVADDNENVTPQPTP